MNQNDCSGKTLKLWPVFVDHYILASSRPREDNFIFRLIANHFIRKKINIDIITVQDQHKSQTKTAGESVKKIF